MSKVFPGRYTAEIDEPFIVFLIGMRVNRIFAVRKWLRTAREMNKMLRALQTHPEKGFLGGQAIRYRRGLSLIQYWRSFGDLERFARHPSEPHLEAWRRYNQTIGATARLASGMKLMWSSRASTRQFMATCLFSAWRQWPGTSPPLGGAKPPADA
jgi:Domain of unknown function (DUF4188)